MRARMAAAVSIACEALTNDELAGMNLAVQLGINPTTRAGYDKIAHLFTEDNGTRMHDETAAALARVALRRLTPHS